MMIRDALVWMFRNRKTGRITVVQFPNVALAVFLLASVVRLIVKPSGSAATVFDVVGTGALLVWALDELIRGVNPWRRMLGGAMLAWEALQLLAR
jgi:hypothetical protein